MSFAGLVCRVSFIVLSICFPGGFVNAEFFDKNGRLTQVEYADKASMNGGTVIGICSDEAAVLLTWSSVTDGTLKLPEKIQKITEHTGVSSSGILSDVKFLTDKMFNEATEHSFVFGSDPPASRMSLSIADYVHDRSISARYRPLGIRMCIASYDETFKASITEIDAIGNLHRCKVSCIGPYSEKYIDSWSKSLDIAKMSVDEMIHSSLTHLKKIVEEDEVDFSAEDVSIAYVSQSTPFTLLNRGSILKYLPQ